MSVGMSLVISSGFRFDCIASIYADFESRKSIRAARRWTPLATSFATTFGRLIRGETTSGRLHAIGEITAPPNAPSPSPSKTDPFRIRPLNLLD